jgi:DNA helicase II / ATP-dependent DNA helicase PcrA
MKKYFLHRQPPVLKVDYAHELNPEQYAAVMHAEGPALVLAGAGSGKTRVVTYRVARLIESGVRAENILLLTFTNKAAREMMRRVELLIGRNITGLSGGTFHHIANLLLRQHYSLAGYRQGFSILDREDSKELLESSSAETGRKGRVIPKGAVMVEIASLAKNTGAGVKEVVQQRFHHFVHALEDITNILEIYEKKKLSLNLMDFDDLLCCWKRIFQENDRIREYYSLKFRHMLVDEYQDTNSLQSDIIDLTAGKNGNLMVVGDDAQSIYSFRGADFENILKFPDKYPGASVFKLTTNYRSTPEILYLANNILRNNRRQFRKELHAVLPSGESPFLVPLRDVFIQAEFVASVVVDQNIDGKAFADISVLYRSHYQSMEVQMEFQRRGIPFEVRSGLKFFEQAHIKDMLSFLKVMTNPHDEISWKRILKLIPGIGNITAGKIWSLIGIADRPLELKSYAAGSVPKKSVSAFYIFAGLFDELSKESYYAAPAEAIDYILRHWYEEHLYKMYPNAEMRIEDIEQMGRFSLRYDSIEMFLSDMTLQGVSEAESEGADETEGRVILSTVHQAKGLEWDTVFLIGMNDGKFPSAKSLKNDNEEEERRLFYVGVTRAKQALYLCYPVTSDDWQTMGLTRQSRFIGELPDDCFEEISVQDV